MTRRITSRALKQFPGLNHSQEAEEAMELAEHETAREIARDVYGLIVPYNPEHTTSYLISMPEFRRYFRRKWKVSL